MAVRRRRDQRHVHRGTEPDRRIWVLDWNCMGWPSVSSSPTPSTRYRRQSQAETNGKWPWDGVKVELVSEEKVRAKRGWTGLRPSGQREVIRFFAHLGKWFLHFSEPESITRPSCRRSRENLDPNCQTAVIYVVGCGCERSSSIRLKVCSTQTERSAGGRIRNVDITNPQRRYKAMAKASPEVWRPGCVIPR